MLSHSHFLGAQRNDRVYCETVYIVWTERIGSFQQRCCIRVIYSKILTLTAGSKNLQDITILQCESKMMYCTPLTDETEYSEFLIFNYSFFLCHKNFHLALIIFIPVFQYAILTPPPLLWEVKGRSKGQLARVLLLSPPL